MHGIRCTLVPWKNNILSAKRRISPWRKRFVSRTLICIQTLKTDFGPWGLKTATPIQGQAIPHAVKGKDILGIAQTGTGKTAAFLLPTMDRIMDTPNDGKVKALIVVPTRELAIQIDQAAQGFAYYTGITSLAIYGGGTGKEFAQEKKALTEGADIIIVTPGRMLSHLTLGYVDLSSLEVLIPR